jgi:hypothetical protein
LSARAHRVFLAQVAVFAVGATSSLQLANFTVTLSMVCLLLACEAPAGPRQAVVDECAELGQGAAQLREPLVSVEFEEISVVDAAHPPIDVLGDRVGRFREGDATPQRIRPDPCER